MRCRTLFTALAIAGAAQHPALAAEALTVATWNLGWHQSRAEAAQWMQACAQPFAQNAQGLWAPSAQGDRNGWQLKWGRDAKIEWDVRVMPPCDVWQARFKPVPMTPAADAKRRAQIADILATQVQADVIALQEVSGEAAVREVLPKEGPYRSEDFHVCSFAGFGVQRLAFAWRKSLGGSPADCHVEPSLSLPHRTPKEQPRPGLALTLTLGGQRVHFLNVHLKSSCVSPLESTQPNGRGQLAGDDVACVILQDQVAPLEAWLERHARDGRVVLLGDFNRQLWHEARLPPTEPVRTRGDASRPHDATARTRNLWRELNDGTPTNSRLTLLPVQCPLNAATQAACEAAEAAPAKEAVQALAHGQALGCRNPIGLDHVVVSEGLKAEPALKVPLGLRGRTLAAKGDKADPLLAVSDHCPLVTRLAF